ncbi:hypothetical protein BaRGS_00016075 [Batillaria attramentaria]|uniref:Uncharacterized protein n=1 Tax=Batillaria attramentaria TaxID=370345 RepID=A0ABD0KZC4_9CAEN
MVQKTLEVKYTGRQRRWNGTHPCRVRFSLCSTTYQPISKPRGAAERKDFTLRLVRPVSYSVHACILTRVGSLVVFRLTLVTRDSAVNADYLFVLRVV